MTLFESRKLVNCKRAALSHTLDKIGCSDIGLVFAGSSLSPDLRIGTMSAFFHGSGKVLKVKELLIRLVIIHQTHYEKSDWSRAFNQFTIACELDMINAISVADIAFIMSSSTSAWLPSPLECSPQKQNG